MVTLLRHCDPAYVDSFDFIVLRQPTRKQNMLHAAWGRAHPIFDVGRHRGNAIVIEAQCLKSVVWDRPLGPAASRELERLKMEGHQILVSRRKVEVFSSPAALRSTVLFRTVLHEMGHFVDYRRSGSVAWGGKTYGQKETFARRFAEDQFRTLADKGCVPFGPIVDDDSFTRDRVRREWFVST
jgi:hypothetical protein